MMFHKLEGILSNYNTSLSNDNTRLDLKNFFIYYI